jgi:hypothetical protein
MARKAKGGRTLASDATWSPDATRPRGILDPSLASSPRYTLLVRETADQGRMAPSP